MSLLCVVEPDRALLALLGRALQDGGLRVDLFGSGAELLRADVDRPYEFVLLDTDQPGVDPVASVELIHSRLPNAQIMVVSAQNDSANRVRCLDGGACDFLGKPFDLSELLARVRAHLRPRAEPILECLETGPLRLDTLRREVQLPDRKLVLPPREFLLLRHLMTRAGHVCTREELLKEVWGYDFSTDSNVVDKYVSRLRTKLPPGLIETVRQVGFCLTVTSFVAADTGSAFLTVV